VRSLLAVLITLGIIGLVIALGFFLIARPVRERRRREFREARSAAQDDLIALSDSLTSHHADVSIQSKPEAAEEQAGALTAYERGTAALDCARGTRDMGTVSRAIAEGQYHLACAEALAADRRRPDRRPSCFFDPRHGMSVSAEYWTPAEGGQGRDVPVCAPCAHKLERGTEPDMRRVEDRGRSVSYVNAGFAPSYWGGFGLGPGLFAGFLLGEALMPYGGLADGFYPGGEDYSGADYGGGDYSGADYGGGDFGGGDFGGGDF
jgi:hypothetical protein